MEPPSVSSVPAKLTFENVLDLSIEQLKDELFKLSIEQLKDELFKLGQDVKG